jgi:glycine dehydrogenase subunit 2
MMIEPTESESRETLDAFAEAMNQIAIIARKTPELLRACPGTTPVNRLDETKAARDMDVCFKGSMKRRLDVP